MTTELTRPRLPAYQPSPEQRSRERWRAVGAAFAILLVVAGVPAALLLGVGSPLPRSMPTVETLTGEISPMAVVRILSVVVWAAWLHFVVCLVLEYRAERAGRAPGAAGPSRSLARRLVTTLVLVGSTAGQAAPALAHAPAPRPAAVATVETPAPAPAPAPATPQRDAAAPRVFYDVRAPQHGHHDTLWGIAERYLGDGLRYKEIAELNMGRPQPDGRRLEKPDLIQPGWVLELPADARGEGLRIVTPNALGATRTAPAARGGAQGGDTVAEAPADAADDQGIGALGALGGLGGAGLLAAGVLAALRRRRGPYGTEPGEDTAAAEVALRLAADESSAAFVDIALRSLAVAQQASGDPLPEVYAAALDADGLLIHAAPAPATAPPAPWRAQGDGWYVRRADVAALATPERGAAPYPGLVTFGRDGDRRVLLDLEAAPGIVALGGDDRVAREIAVSVAVELATNVWSDDVRVTMVGFGDDLSMLAPGRLRQVATLDEALDDVAARQRDDTEVLRGRLARHDRWTPDFVVLSAPPSAAEAERLVPLVSEGRQAVGVLAVGDVPAARWRFAAAADGGLDTGVLGLHLEAQRLRVAQYAALLDLFAAVDRDAGRAPVVDLRALPGDQPRRPVPPHHLDTARPCPVEVRVLGPVAVEAPGPVDAERRDVLTEVVAYLALAPDGAHPAALAAAIWPRGVSDEVRDAALAHVQAWLGNDSAGRPRAHVDTDGRWRLSAADVRVDWHVFRELAGEADEVRLARALGLVRGPALSATPPGRYAWLARSGLEREVLVTAVAAAHAAVEQAVARGGERDAVVHAWAGLTLAPRAELLWRDLLACAARRRDRDAAVGIVEAMWETIGGGVRDATAAETDALVAELLPGYRTPAA